MFSGNMFLKQNNTKETRESGQQESREKLETQDKADAGRTRCAPDSLVLAQIHHHNERTVPS
jgi:hypothetical protein